MKEIEFLELGEFVNPIERIARRYRHQEGNETLVTLLELAIAVSDANQGDRPTVESAAEALQNSREGARRNEAISADLIGEIHKIADEAGEESFSEQYGVMEVAQAAAVGCAPLILRNESSLRLAIAAKSAGHLERARVGYADTIEGMRIMARFFKVDQAAYVQVEDKYQRNWQHLADKHGIPRAVLDPVGDDLASEWAEFIRWHSDFGPNAGLLSQSDAFLRLAIRWESWRDVKGQDLTSPVNELLEQWSQPRDGVGGESSTFTIARFLVTAGDALLEIGEWTMAARAFDQMLAGTEADTSHPLGQHAVVQSAYAHLMSDDLRTCRKKLDMLDKERLHQLSKLIVTVAAEFARFLAVEYAYRKRMKESVSGDIHQQIREQLRLVTQIMRTDPASRTDYLRTLFVSVLMRDIHAIEQM